MDIVADTVAIRYRGETCLARLAMTPQFAFRHNRRAQRRLHAALFLRHGEAVNREEWTGAESERPLTPSGRDEMEQVAGGLTALELGAEVVVTSTFTRADATARIAAEALQAPATASDELTPGATLAGLLRILQAHDDASRIMLVGHEPDFSQMIGELIAAPNPASLDLKKAAARAWTCRAVPSGARLEPTTFSALERSNGCSHLISSCLWAATSHPRRARAKTRARTDHLSEAPTRRFVVCWAIMPPPACARARSRSLTTNWTHALANQHLRRHRSARGRRLARRHVCL